MSLFGYCLWTQCWQDGGFHSLPWDQTHCQALPLATFQLGCSQHILFMGCIFALLWQPHKTAPNLFYPLQLTSRLKGSWRSQMCSSFPELRTWGRSSLDLLSSLLALPCHFSSTFSLLISEHRAGPLAVFWLSRHSAREPTAGSLTRHGWMLPRNPRCEELLC